jgi:hypothetical protein
MEAKKESCSEENIKIKDSEADHVDHDDHKPELSLSLEKLNLAPKKKKLLVLNLNGFLSTWLILLLRMEFLKSRAPDHEYLNFYRNIYLNSIIHFIHF